jgi:hypothetical protein
MRALSKSMLQVRPKNLGRLGPRPEASFNGALDRMTRSPDFSTGLRSKVDSETLALQSDAEGD